ncbi:MAG: hypothetical protein AAB364_03305 [Patescibacteria group bacterium]
MSVEKVVPPLEELGTICQILSGMGVEDQRPLATTLRKICQQAETSLLSFAPQGLESLIHVFGVILEADIHLPNVWCARLRLTPESWPSLAIVSKFQLVDPREAVWKAFPRDQHPIVNAYQAKECIVNMLASRGLRLATETEITMAQTLLATNIFAGKKLCQLGSLEPEAQFHAQMDWPLCSAGSERFLWVPAMPADVESCNGPLK